MQRISLRLRALEPEDLETLYQLENDRDEWDKGGTTVPFSYYALRDYIANNAYDIYTDKQLRQAIVTNDETSKTNDKVIGLIDLLNYEPRHQRAEVSVIIAKEYRNQGIASEAMQQLISYSRDFLHLNQLYAITSETNIPFQRLMQRLHFEHTCTLKSWLQRGEKRDNALFFQLFLKKD